MCSSILKSIYLAISTELDYISDEEESDPIVTDSPINSSIEFELEDLFPEMATNYNAPTTSSASKKEQKTWFKKQKRNKTIASINTIKYIKFILSFLI